MIAAMLDSCGKVLEVMGWGERPDPWGPLSGIWVPGEHTSLHQISAVFIWLYLAQAITSRCAGTQHSGVGSQGWPGPSSVTGRQGRND